VSSQLADAFIPSDLSAPCY